MHAKSMTRGATLLLVVAFISLSAGAPLWAQPGWNVTQVGQIASDSAYAVALSSDGHYAYVVNGDAGMQVVDVFNPYNPDPKGTFDPPPPGFAFGVAVYGSTAYVADHDAGLRVVDVSNPDLPYEQGYYDTDGAAYDVAISSDGIYAYVADNYFGLVMLNVSTTTPSLVGPCDTPGDARGVALSSDDHYAYVADGNNSGLRVVDVDPSSPYFLTVIGHCPTPGFARDVAVSGNYAYIADGWTGLRVVDVSNPNLPNEVGYYYTSWASGVAVSGSHAYVASEGEGLRVVDVSDPATPLEVGFYNTPGYALGVAVFGDYAYVADCFYFGIYDCSDAVSVEPEKPAEIPASFTLCPPHPNPFNASTVISFELPVASFLKLEVFDVSGRDVGAHSRSAAPFSGAPFQPGTHQITFDGSNLPSGIYLARLTAGEYSAVQKLVLLK